MTTIRTSTPDGRTLQVVQPSRTDEFVQSRCMRVFVSYRDGHDKAALEMARRMKIYGIDTFVAFRDIPVGARWEADIQRALITCDVFAAHCTPDFGDGYWTTREVELAELHEKQIFPVRVAELPSGPIAKYQALDPNTNPDPVIALIDTYIALPRMTESLVCAIETCAHGGSFELANRLARFLSNVRHMSDEEAERLITTYNQKTCLNGYGNTNQIRAAYNFRPSYASPAQSVLTEKINELTGLSVCHGSNGDICEAPPTSVVAPQRAAAKPAFTREISRDSYAEDRHMSAVSRTQSERKVSSPVSPR